MSDPRPSAESRPRRVLFLIPEYDRAFAEFTYTATNALMRAKSEVFGMIRQIPLQSVPSTTNVMPSGEVVQIEPVAVQFPYEVKFDDVVNFNLDGFAASIDDAAEHGLDILMPRFFEHAGRLAEATGNTVQAEGQPYSFGTLTRLIEKMPIRFDENGNPTLPILVLSPNAAAEHANLPPPTREEQDAWEGLIERKRQEFNDRRRRRKLS